ALLRRRTGAVSAGGNHRRSPRRSPPAASGCGGPVAHPGRPAHPGPTPTAAAVLTVGRAGTGRGTRGAQGTARPNTGISHDPGADRAAAGESATDARPPPGRVLATHRACRAGRALGIAAVAQGRAA